MDVGYLRLESRLNPEDEQYLVSGVRVYNVESCAESEAALCAGRIIIIQISTRVVHDGTRRHQGAPKSDYSVCRNLSAAPDFPSVLFFRGQRGFSTNYEVRTNST